MKTFILASLLALTAVSGVVVTSQPAHAITPQTTPERLDPIQHHVPTPALAPLHPGGCGCVNINGAWVMVCH